MVKKTLPWEKSLRELLRATNGKGWTCQNMRGKMQVQIVLEDGARTSLSTDLLWEGSNTTQFIDLCAKLKDLMVNQSLGLAEAYKLIDRKEIKATKSNGLAWENIIQKFKESKILSNELSEDTWKKNQQLRMTRCLEILESIPRPISSKELSKNIQQQQAKQVEEDRFKMLLIYLDLQSVSVALLLDGCHLKNSF